MSKLLTHEEVVHMLRRAVRECGTQEKYGAMHYLSASYVSQVIHGNIAPGAAVLNALGLEKIVFYRRKHERQS